MASTAKSARFVFDFGAIFTQGNERFETLDDVVEMLQADQRMSFKARWSHKG